MAEQKKLRIIDNLNVTEVACNKFIGAMFDGAGVGITLGYQRALPDRTESPPPAPSIVVTTRIVLTPAAAVEMMNGLHQLLSTIGAITTNLPTAPPQMKN